MSRMPNNLNYASSWETAGTSNPAITRFFNAVYAWMCAGLALTAVTAFLVAQWVQGVIASHNTAALSNAGIIFIVLFIAEIALVGTIAGAINRISAGVATGLFLLYAAINGVTLAGIFLVYAKSTLASAFVVSAGTFGVMSVFGFVTKRDLTAMGRILFMLLIGVIIASIVSIFWHNSALQVLINYVGVAVFVGLTAYDTQRLKGIAEQTQDNPAMASRLAISGSLMLYLDFINLFLFILRIMNQNRR
jgi:FtsH-binding integral membrane protein